MASGTVQCRTRAAPEAKALREAAAGLRGLAVRRSVVFPPGVPIRRAASPSSRHAAASAGPSRHPAREQPRSGCRNGLWETGGLNGQLVERGRYTRQASAGAGTYVGTVTQPADCSWSRCPASLLRARPLGWRSRWSAFATDSRERSMFGTRALQGLRVSGDSLTSGRHPASRVRSGLSHSAPALILICWPQRKVAVLSRATGVPRVSSACDGPPRNWRTRRKRD